MSTREHTKHSFEELFKALQVHLPDVQVTKADMMAPTAQFMRKFATAVVNYFDEKVALLLNEELEPLKDASELTLYLKLSSILHIVEEHSGMKIIDLTLIDLYRPVPKRTQFIIEVIAHFIQFIEVHELVEEKIQTVFAIQQKAIAVKTLEGEKQQIIEESNEIAKNLAVCKDREIELNNEKKQIDIEYENMLKEKAAYEQIVAQEEAEIEKLRVKVQNIDYEVKNMQDENKLLQQQVVTVEEFEDLKEMEKKLINEEDYLSNNDCDMEGGAGEGDNQLEHANELLKLVTQIDLGALNQIKNKQIALKEDLVKEENKLRTQTEEKDNAAAKNKELKNNLENLNKKLDELKKLLHDLKDKELDSIKTNKENRKNLQDKMKMFLKEQEDLNEEFEDKLQYKAKLTKEQDDFRNFVLECYKQVMDVTNVPINKLSDLFTNIIDLKKQ